MLTAGFKRSTSRNFRIDDWRVSKRELPHASLGCVSATQRQFVATFRGFEDAWNELEGPPRSTRASTGMVCKTVSRAQKRGPDEGRQWWR